MEEAASYCGADAVRDEEALTRSLALGVILAEQALADAWREVPEPVLDEVVLRTTYAIFAQAKTGSESGSFLGADGTQLVPGVPNDPLRKSWELIKRYTNRV